jgi:hypothetical protein
MKIISFESGSDTLIRSLDKRCGVGRQEHYTNVFISIERFGMCPGALSKRNRILKDTFTLSQPSIHHGIHWQNKIQTSMP